ncbi:hypothetical protein ALP36_103090 [Pseudomonas syringae pv. coriandricola]|uniref:Uncharacterized protein n=1 Tax=Pseudomonas syringae pv. coriandricola TaxID=264453 RepID=A0A3M5R8X8_9PSED|nr:hypothetical protein ALO54_102683 [Pseudomonas syringae pv. philadelphi]RMM25477.1 hypothetical protein ALQ83_102763 [Pseudomonas syringae pv. berberidis]RMR32613.1 hypothetical protein ALP87_102987 [Pseudomonas syringae pv. coriandricola]RMU04947.1 hypothetical protein ALP36_103090 [Pseudomonas syringae pv. coriandricola]
MMKSWWAFCSIGLSVTSRNPYPSWKGYVHEPPPEWLGSKQCQRTDVAMLAEENVVSKCLFRMVFCKFHFVQSCFSSPFGIHFRRARRPFRVRHLPLFPIPFKPFAFPFCFSPFCPFIADNPGQAKIEIQ